jgi:hypothetical protein
MLRCLLPMLVVSLGFTSAPAQTLVARPANELKALLDEDVDAVLRRFPLQATRVAFTARTIYCLTFRSKHAIASTSANVAQQAGVREAMRSILGLLPA